jgi:hypothetical protein
MPWTKPVFGLNSVGEMYIIYGSNILRQIDFHAVFAALQKQGSPGAHDRCRIGIEGNQVLKRADGRNATSRFRVLGNFGNPMRVFPSEAHAPCALGQQRGRIRR